VTVTGAAVSVAGVDVSFGGPAVLDGFSLDLEPGSITALLGPSGCGKTTALRVVAGLERPSAGSVVVAGEVVCSPTVFVPPERRRVGLVFQNGALFPHLDVAGNVGYGLARGERRTGARIDEMLALVGLEGLADRTPDSLSGGQAQRVALARALAPSPDVLLLDEPFANLDAVLRARLRGEVAGIVRAAGVTALIVTHDRDEAFAMADHLAVMRDGRVVQAGVPAALYRDPADPWVASFVGDVSGWPDAGAPRPEDLELTEAGSPGARRGRVADLRFAGPDTLVRVELDEGSGFVLVRARSAGVGVRPGAMVGVRPRP